MDNVRKVANELIADGLVTRDVASKQIATLQSQIGTMENTSSQKEGDASRLFLMNLFKAGLLRMDQLAQYADKLKLMENKPTPTQNTQQSTALSKPIFKVYDATKDDGIRKMLQFDFSACVIQYITRGKKVIEIPFEEINHHDVVDGKILITVLTGTSYHLGLSDLSEQDKIRTCLSSIGHGDEIALVEEDVLKQGYLDKKGPAYTIGTKKRYIKVTHGKLSYYKMDSSDNTENPLNTIVLNVDLNEVSRFGNDGFTIVPKTSNEKEFSFMVPKGKLKVDDLITEREAWVAAIKEAYITSYIPTTAGVYPTSGSFHGAAKRLDSGAVKTGGYLVALVKQEMDVMLDVLKEYGAEEEHASQITKITALLNSIEQKLAENATTREPLHMQPLPPYSQQEMLKSMKTSDSQTDVSVYTPPSVNPSYPSSSPSSSLSSVHCEDKPSDPVTYEEIQINPSPYEVPDKPPQDCTEGPPAVPAVPALPAPDSNIISTSPVEDNVVEEDEYEDAIYDVPPSSPYTPTEADGFVNKITGRVSTEERTRARSMAMSKKYTHSGMPTARFEKPFSKGDDEMAMGQLEHGLLVTTATHVDEIKVARLSTAADEIYDIPTLPASPKLATTPGPPPTRPPPSPPKPARPHPTSPAPPLPSRESVPSMPVRDMAPIQDTTVEYDDDATLEREETVLETVLDEIAVQETALETVLEETALETVLEESVQESVIETVYSELLPVDDLINDMTLPNIKPVPSPELNTTDPEDSLYADLPIPSPLPKTPKPTPSPKHTAPPTLEVPPPPSTQEDEEHVYSGHAPDSDTQLALVPSLPPQISPPSHPATVPAPKLPGAPPRAPGAVLLPAKHNPKQPLIVPKVKVFPIHWQKIPPISFKKSVWVEMTDKSASIDVSKLEELFATKPAKLSVQPKKKAAEQKNLLDPKRSQNLGIFLHGAALQPTDITELVSKIKRSDSVSIENVTTLQKFAPTNDDRDVFGKVKLEGVYKLDKADQFMWHMIHTPFLAQRLHILEVTMTLPSDHDDMKEVVDNIMDVCSVLLTNNSFIKFLEIILTIGNMMNAAIKKTSPGFKLSSTLPKLTNIRTPDKSVTLLDYIVEQVIAVDPECLSFIKELENCHRASTSASIISVTAEVDLMRQDMSKLSEQAGNLSKYPPEGKHSEDLEGFVNDVRAFVKLFQSNVVLLSQQCVIMKNKYLKVLERFGESPNTDSEEFLKILSEFLTALVESLKRPELTLPDSVAHLKPKPKVVNVNIKPRQMDITGSLMKSTLFKKSKTESALDTSGNSWT